MRLWTCGMACAVATVAGAARGGDEIGTLYATTYDSGSTLEYGSRATTDGDGNVLVLAYAYNDATGGDVYVTKLSSRGEIVFVRDISGSALDVPGGIAADEAGDIYVSGRTSSDDFPIVNAIQPIQNGPGDAFLTKLSGDDGSIVFSTFIGGSRHEGLADVAITPDGQVVVAGYTDSIDLPLVDPVQDHLVLLDCFCDDAFVMRLTPDGQTITFSTYLGGRFRDQAHDVGVDDAGRITIAGTTRSDDFPVVDAFQPLHAGGEEDLFVARIDPETPSLEYATYLGGETEEVLRDLEVTGDGRAYLAGYTQSITFPTSPGAFQEDFVGEINGCGSPPFEPIHNCSDAFVTSLDESGGLAFGTFLGGLEPDQADAIAVASDGSVRIAGYTSSPDFPGNPGVPLDSRAFVAQLTPDGSGLDYTQEIPTTTPGSGHGLAIGPDGTTHFAGAYGVIDGNFIHRDLLVVGLDTATGCPADFNGDGDLNVLDFVAYQDAFVAGDPAADCDGSGSLDVLDFVCFQGLFSAGCP